jgi:hypothetical protein
VTSTCRDTLQHHSEECMTRTTIKDVTTPYDASPFDLFSGSRRRSQSSKENFFQPMNRAQPRIPTLLCTDKSYCKPRGLNQGFSFVRVRKWHHFSSTKDISLASSLARASTCDLIIATTNRRQVENMYVLAETGTIPR